MSTTKWCEGASNYHTLVGPILYRIWRLQNVPYKVAACLHLLRKGAKQVAIVTAGSPLRIHSSHSSILKAH